MPKPRSGRLKVHHDPPTELDRPASDEVGWDNGAEWIASLTDELSAAFGQATGWRLKWGGEESDATGHTGHSDSGSRDRSRSLPVIPNPAARPSDFVTPDVGTAPSHDLPEPLSGDANADGIPRASAQRLADGLVRLADELAVTRRALWQREAELAAGVPVVVRPDEADHLAARLRAVLKGGAQAIGCDAAALYLLDPATTQLKLRSCWGLPPDRLSQPARALAGAIGDLEALTGHAVVLSDSSLFDLWHAPEPFGAAVCVPVSTPAMPLGTLWVFAGRPRDFSDQETNLVEIVAGRLASDLEREMLLSETTTSTRHRRQIEAAEQWQLDERPQTTPAVEGWDVAGWSDATRPLGGDFYDWFVPDAGRLAVAIGATQAQGVEGAMNASAMRSAVRALGPHHRRADRLLAAVNRTLWTGSAGSHAGGLTYATIDLQTGRFSLASAPLAATRATSASRCAESATIEGFLGGIVIGRQGVRTLFDDRAGFGIDPDATFPRHAGSLRPGDALVLLHQPARSERDSSTAGDTSRRAASRTATIVESTAPWWPWSEREMAAALMPYVDRPAKNLVDAVRRWMALHGPAGTVGRTVVAVRRTATRGRIAGE